MWRPSTHVLVLLLLTELAARVDTNIESKDYDAGMWSISGMWKSSQKLVKCIRLDEYVLRVDGRTQLAVMSLCLMITCAGKVRDASSILEMP